MNIGERVGDYEIVAILGAGGMGQVYKVRSVLSDRVEAMKVLLPNLGSDTVLAERFLREIKVQATLDHPNIARLNSAQQVGNQLIMLMEYVEGGSIDALLHQGPLELSESLRYTSQVLDAAASIIVLPSRHAMRSPRRQFSFLLTYFPSLISRREILSLAKRKACSIEPSPKKSHRRSSSPTHPTNTGDALLH